MKVISCMQISMETCYKLIVWFSWGWTNIPKVSKIARMHWLYNISKKELEMKLSFACIKVCYKVILSLLIGMIKHTQNTQSNKFAISLQYIKKEVRNGVRFLHADKHQSFYKLALSFLIKVARYVQSTQSRKLIIFLQYIKEKYRNCFCVLLWCKTFKYFTEVQSCSSLRFLGGCGLKYAQPFRSWNS